MHYNDVYRSMGNLKTLVTQFSTRLGGLMRQHKEAALTAVSSYGRFLAL